MYFVTRMSEYLFEPETLTFNTFQEAASSLWIYVSIQSGKMSCKLTNVDGVIFAIGDDGYEYNDHWMVRRYNPNQLVDVSREGFLEYLYDMGKSDE